MCALIFKSSHRLHMGDSRLFSFFLQGGGVAVFGGTVAISSCTISGNTVQVHAHVRKFPEWENALMTPSISILIFLMGAASNYQYGVRAICT